MGLFSRTIVSHYQRHEIMVSAGPDVLRSAGASLLGALTGHWWGATGATDSFKLSIDGKLVDNQIASELGGELSGREITLRGRLPANSRWSAPSDVTVRVQMRLTRYVYEVYVDNRLIQQEKGTFGGK